jgi:outer membrane protein
MIKKILLAVLLAAPMCLSAQTLKFGTVNTQEVFNQMPDKATAENTLKETAAKYDAEGKKLQEAFAQLQADYEKLEADATTPKAIKDRRMQELQETYQKIQNFQQTAGQELQRSQEALLAPIMDKLQNAIKAVGAEGGYTFIYDMSMGVVLYAGNGAEDVTPLVKAKLGIKYSNRSIFHKSRNFNVAAFFCAYSK